MNAIVKLKQGTQEWHEHRKLYRNASESPVVMGLSPWMTPFQLWQLKTGRTQPAEATAPMKHGTEMEPAARAVYEAETGFVMQPLVMTSGEYSASLDGITLRGDLIVEIKCPYKGQASDLWQSVEAGEIPEMYRVQIQHQMMVSGAKLAHLWVFDGTVGLLVEIKHDEVCQQRIKNAWDEFSNLVDTDAPPPLSELDTELRDDDEWVLSAQLYRDAKVNSEDAAKKLDEAKDRLTSLASDHPSIKGGGVTVSRFWKAGNIDYKNVPEITGVDLEQYRGEGSWVVKVSVDRTAKANSGVTS
jgi:putative phage-type endonuclease